MNTTTNLQDGPNGGNAEPHNSAVAPAVVVTNSREDAEFASLAAATATAYQSGDLGKKPRRRVSFLRVTIQSCFAVLVVFGLGAAVLWWVLLNSSVSNEQIRAQIESQLTTFLGADHSAVIGETKIALGDGGLLSIDASNVKILRDNILNLGVAREVGVKVKSLPLIKGNIVAESVTMRGASIAVDTLLPQATDKDLRPAWPRSVNLSTALQSIGDLIDGIARQVENAGLESLALEDTNLVGFDQFGLRSSTAKFESLTVDAVKGPSGDNDLEFKALLITQHGKWNLKGRWSGTAAGGRILQFDADGLNIDELVGPTAGDLWAGSLNNRVSLNFSAPYQMDGTPTDATAAIKIGAGAIPVGKGLHAQLQQADIKLRLEPQANTLSIDPSSLSFVGSKVKFHGGIRYPSIENDPISSQPLFRIEVDEFQAFGLVEGDNPPVGKLSLEGFLDPLRQIVEADHVEIVTPNGRMTGDASIRLDGEEPHVKLALIVDSMPVEEFKQFWPAILAPKARKWMSKNMTGGQMNDAWVKADLPAGVIGRDANYQPQNLSVRIPIVKTALKNPGELPQIVDATGVLEVNGNETNITLDSGVANLPDFGPLRLAKSTMVMGNYAIPDTPATLNLKFAGSAAAMVKLASLKPLGFQNRLKIQPTHLKGNASAEVEAHFMLSNKKMTLNQDKPWKTKIKAKGVSSTKPVNGRKMVDANMIILASPAVARIEGTAVMDGVPVKLALLEPLDGSAASQGKIQLTLSDADRRNMGLNTGDVVMGPIKATITNLGDGTQRVEADLKQAKLNFPWVGWSKGKGIGAKATFLLRQSGNIKSFKDVKLRGEGFSANGSFSVDKSGLSQAKITDVILNKSDNFDIALKRSKNSYKIKLNARSYDGRALIRSLLNAKLKPDKNAKTTISVTGQVGRLIGFEGQELRDVKLDFLQRGGAVARVIVDAMAPNNAPTKFDFGPVPGGTKTDITTSNAGSVLRFLDLYTKIRGGSIRANLIRDDSQVFRGRVLAEDFILLNEPRLAQLLQKPKAAENLANGDEVVQTLRRIKTDRAHVDRLQASIEKGPGFFNLSKGRLTGGDASAAFEGKVYDRNNKMNISGTFLPGRALNRMVSKIPIIGLAFGRGKVNGLLGITFRLSGRFDNPKLQVNPLSIIAPGVFRQVFKF
ncbi:MAG: hypothetical protein GKR97_03120 [Rhizobiaceae bacterium]|nr:hypothetical protein [Rhizobiaceae bacterium]